MRPLTLLSFVSLSALVVLGGCSSSTMPSTGTTGCTAAVHSTGTMTAQINGVPWTAVCIFNASVPGAGVVAFSGTDNEANSLIAQIIALGVVTKTPGTFNVSNGLTGANGNLTIGTLSFQANIIQGSGTITFTTLSATAVSGTFSFSLVATPPATGTKTITNGAFNITF